MHSLKRIEAQHAQRHLQREWDGGFSSQDSADRGCLSHCISLSQYTPKHPENTSSRSASLLRHHQMPFQRPGLIEQPSFSSLTLFIPTITTNIQTNYWTWADEQRRRRKKELFFSSLPLRFYGLGSARRLGPFVLYSISLLP
ncbi:hypothetical protein LZ30DRAFT_798083, partial [Colletotrichum cereale]